MNNKYKDTLFRVFYLLFKSIRTRNEVHAKDYWERELTKSDLAESSNRKELQKIRGPP
jgi:hypothetical protein